MGGLVFGIGIVVMLVVWNDFEFVNGMFIVGVFNLEGLMDGIMYVDYSIVGMVVMFVFILLVGFVSNMLLSSIVYVGFWVWLVVGMIFVVNLIVLGVMVDFVVIFNLDYLLYVIY